MSRTAEWIERREAAVPRGIATKPLVVRHAQGAELWDVDGRRLIDFAGGIAVLNVGHRHPKVMAAVRSQLDAFTHLCFHVANYEPYIRLAERLNALVPGAFAKKTMFATAGAEAVENAVKIARAYTGRPAVVAFSGAFHGRTLMGMALTGKVDPYKKGFGPFPADVFHVQFPDLYRGGSAAASIEALQRLFETDVEPSRVAAVIIEPVQGEGGFNVAPAAFLRQLRALCDQHGILLIADEIQTGFARTGRMFAIEHAGVAADLVTMAKSLAGGLPLSAVTGRAEVMDAVGPGGIGGTYGGNPLACAAAHAVLDVIAEEGLVERAERQGAIIQDRLEAMRGRNLFACIGDVRGLGAMIAVELVEERASRRPATQLTKDLVARCQERGLVLLSCGIHGNVIRFLAPLTASEALVEEGLDILESSLADLVTERAELKAASV